MSILTIKRSLYALVAGVTLATGGAGTAHADCAARNAIYVNEFKQPLFRELLLLAKQDVESFYGIKFDHYCLDLNQYTALYNPKQRLVLLGWPLVKHQANGPGKINAIYAIMAHEGAHAFQAQYNLLKVLTKQNKRRVKCIELHADFMSGTFMGWRSQLFNVDLKNMSRMFHDLGDRDYQSDGHHGKPAERYLSFRQGFLTKQPDVKKLAMKGMKYVSKADCDN